MCYLDYVRRGQATLTWCAHNYQTIENSGSVHPSRMVATESNLMLLRIVPSKVERAAESLASETIEQAVSSFRMNGALIVENIVDAAIIAEARQAFGQRYSHYLKHSDPESVLRVGGGRLQITIKLEPPFDSSPLFANP